MRANVCPCCGTDITVDAPIVIDDFSMFGDGYPLVYKGKPLRLTPRESALCWALMKSYPYHLSKDALLNHIGSEDAETNVIEVFLSRLRRKLSMAEIPNPVQSIRCKGLKWMSAAEIVL